VRDTLDSNAAELRAARSSGFCTLGMRKRKLEDQKQKKGRRNNTNHILICLVCAKMSVPLPGLLGSNRKID
jgi:hypothetical protein